MPKNSGAEVKQESPQAAEARSLVSDIEDVNHLIEIFARLVNHNPDVLDKLKDVLDTDPSQTKLFVRSLSWNTTDESLKAAFEQFGEVVDAVAIKDKATNRAKGFGFVTFSNAKEAQIALEQPVKTIDGRTVTCNLASKKRKDRENRLNQGNYPSKNWNHRYPNNNGTGAGAGMNGVGMNGVGGGVGGGSGVNDAGGVNGAYTTNPAYGGGYGGWGYAVVGNSVGYGPSYAPTGMAYSANGGGYSANRVAYTTSNSKAGTNGGGYGSYTNGRNNPPGVVSVTHGSAPPPSITGSSAGPAGNGVGYSGRLYDSGYGVYNVGSGGYSTPAGYTQY